MQYKNILYSRALADTFTQWTFALTTESTSHHHHLIGRPQLLSISVGPEPLFWLRTRSC